MSDTFKNNLLILQNKIYNNRTKTMISLLRNKEIQNYDILTIQK